MLSFEAISEIKNQLPESAWSWVIPALRQDDTLWNSLQDPEFREVAIYRLGSRPNNWTPMNLALLTLDPTLTLDGLRASPGNPLPPQLKKLATQAYQVNAGEDTPSFDLRMAGLLALYFAEHPEAPLPASLPWKTVLACLFALQADPLAYLAQLPPRLAAHTFLSQPFPPKKQRQLASELLASLEDPQRYRLFKHLAGQHPNLGSYLAQAALDGSIPTFHPEAGDLNPGMENLTPWLLTAETQALAGQLTPSINWARKAWEKALEIQYQLASRLLRLQIAGGDLEDAQATWQSLPNPPQTCEDDLVLALAEHGHIAAIAEWLPFEAAASPSGTGSSHHVVASAWQAAAAGRDQQAGELASTALTGYLDETPTEATPVLLLARLFQKLNQTDDAIRCLQVLLKEWPNHLEAIRLLAKSYRAAHRLEESIHTRHLAVALAPQRADLHRDLAATLESAGLWSQALDEWETVVALQEPAEEEDLHRLAHCSLHAGKPDLSTTICEDILKTNPDSDVAHWLLGKSHQLSGRFRKAEGYFKTALQLAPQKPQPWLALADLYHQHGEMDKYLEVLETAVNAAPQTPEIHLALGEYHLQAENLTEALGCLEQAYHLLSSSETGMDEDTPVRIQLAYGKTLFRLGHHEQAVPILRDAYKAHPGFDDLAYTYAKALLAIQQFDLAVDPLREAVRTAPKSLDPRLDLAKVLLDTATDFKEAGQLLAHILETDPHHMEAKILLAKVYEVSGEPNKALDIYTEALNTALPEDHGSLNQLYKGLGRVALATSQADTAIAALNKALGINGEDVETLRLLVEGYKAAALKDKALNTAWAALQLGPTNRDHLNWFIQQALDLEAPQEAISALENALEEEPDQADLLLRMGWLQVEQKDLAGARQTFMRVKSLNPVHPADLLAAAKGFTAMEDTREAIQCLEKATLVCQQSAQSEALPGIYAAKAEILQGNGEFDLALQSLEAALALKPQDPALFEAKARLLLRMGQAQDAVSFVEKGIAALPDHPSTILLAAKIYRAGGDLHQAFTLAQEALDQYQLATSEGLPLSAAVYIADIADAMLYTGAARKLLESATTSPKDDRHALQYHCLVAELALEHGEEVAAAQALTAALEKDPRHPRVLALQSRLPTGAAASQESKHLLQQALDIVGDARQATPPTGLDSPVRTWLAVAEAAVHHKEWDAALALLQRAAEEAPSEPRPRLALARALVLRAEYQRTCQLLNITRHAPGREAIAKTAHQRFEKALLTAANQISDLPASSPFQRFTSSDSEAAEYTTTQIAAGDPKVEVATWLARGQATFQPSVDHALGLDKLPSTPGNQAALLATLRICGENSQAENRARHLLQEEGKESLDPDLLGQIALALVRADPDMARDAVQAAIQLAIVRHLPHRPVFFAIQAFIAHRTRHIAEHFQAIQSALQIWPDEPTWLAIAAELALAQSQTPEAIGQAVQYLERAVELEPQCASHALKLANVHQKQGETQRAILALENATHYNPGHAGLWLALAEAYHDRGDYDQTLRCATTAQEIDASNPASSQLLAQVALQMKEPQKALHHIQNVLSSAPDDPQAWLVKSKAHQALGQPKEALMALDKALPKMPASISLQLERAWLLRDTHGEMAAVEALKDLHEQHPHHIHILVALAEAYRQLGDWQNAIQAAQEALQKAGDQPDAPEYNSILLLLGQLLRTAGHLDQAIHHLSEAIELSPDDPAPYIELGRCYHDQQKYPRALEAFQQAMSMDPENPQPYFFAGLTLKEIKDYDDAEAMFKRAARLDPQDVAIRRQLGAVTVFNLVHNPHHASQEVLVQSP